jgi:hypothetical protein
VLVYRLEAAPGHERDGGCGRRCARGRWLTAAAALGLLACVAEAKVDFNREIRPILSDTCFACHGFDEKERKGQLRLDVRESALQPAKSGETALVPHQPDASELIRRLTTADEEDHMPPAKTGKKLTEAQIGLLKQWIEEGAEYQSHWSFVAPTRPVLPEVRQSDWPRTAMDRFILARLEQDGLKPSPEASKETLIRRLALDLTGLPAPARGGRRLPGGHVA